MGFLTATAAPAKGGLLSALLHTRWGILWLWLLILNLIAFFTYGADKVLAKIKARHPSVRRIPEKTLLLLAALGGGIGAWLGMELFRHKTQHRIFRVGVPLLTLAWVAIAGGLYLYFNILR